MPKIPGFVYVLFNPSAEGLVKIGKTTKYPEERARELSVATGVPTPLVVVYRAFFQDCASAETFVHTLLIDKRLSSNKEFFRTTTTDAVNAIIQAERRFNSGPNGDDTTKTKSDDISSATTGSSEEIWRDVLETADAYYYGWDDNILQDYEEALRLYKQAAKLGCSEAYRKIGDMYKWDEGVNEDKKQALYYYQLGAQNGDGACWGEMAICYFENKEQGNSDKCWVKFLTNPSIKDNPEVNLGYFIDSFVKYMDSSRFFKHHEALESFYQELKKGGL